MNLNLQRICFRRIILVMIDIHEISVGNKRFYIYSSSPTSWD